MYGGENTMSKPEIALGGRLRGRLFYLVYMLFNATTSVCPR